MSALRTVLEECFTSDSRVSPQNRATLASLATDIAAPATTLACTMCLSVLNNPQYGGRPPDSPSLLASLSLLRVIVGKVPIGAHVSNEMLTLLFSVAECAASCEQSAVVAVEALTDLVGRRLIPRNNLTQVRR